MLAGFDTMYLVAGAAFVIIAAAGWALSGDDGEKQKRVGAVTNRARLRGKRQTSALDAAASRRKLVQENLKELEERQKKNRKKSLSLKAKIEQAGLEFEVRSFYIVSIIFALVVAAGFLASGRELWVALAAGAAGGFGVPRWVLGLLCARRRKKFSNEFANAIDVIVRGVKSGLPVHECLGIIANEAPQPVSGEFQQVTESLAMGVSMDDALRRMYERMPLQELNFFAIVLTIQQKTGGNLSEALGNLSTVLRSRKLMREKIAALSGEAKASAFIIGSLPPAVMGIVAVTTPSYMGLMFSEQLGKIMLACGFMWMGIGVFIMKRMISFRI